MSLNWVPPTRVEVSPVVSYQNGASASAKAASLKLVLRHAVMSGSDASFVPRKNLQVACIGDTVLVMEFAAALNGASQYPEALATPALRSWRDRFALGVRRIEAGVQNLLRLQGALGPLLVEPSVADGRGEVAEQVHFLRVRVPLALFCHG